MRPVWLGLRASRGPSHKDAQGRVAVGQVQCRRGRMVPAGGLWGMLDGVDIHGGPCGPRVRAVGGPALGWRWVSTVASRSGYAAAGFGGGDTSDYVTEEENRRTPEPAAGAGGGGHVSPDRRQGWSCGTQGASSRTCSPRVETQNVSFPEHFRAGVRRPPAPVV